MAIANSRIRALSWPCFSQASSTRVIQALRSSCVSGRSRIPSGTVTGGAVRRRWK
jgi:hypothetical protein